QNQPHPLQTQQYFGGQYDNDIDYYNRSQSPPQSPPQSPQNYSTRFAVDPRQVTRSPSYGRSGELSRNRSMIRPERHRPRPTMINNQHHRTASIDPNQSQTNPQQQGPSRLSRYGSNGSHHKKKVKKDLFADFHFWPFFAKVATFWAPSFIISKCGMRDPLVRQAWREKVTLCMIIIFICLLLAILTFGLRPALCPEDTSSRAAYSIRQDNNSLVKVVRDDVLIYGKIYNFSLVQSYLSQVNNITMNTNFKGVDLSPLFDNTNGACARYDALVSKNITATCKVEDPYSPGIFLQAADGNCLPTPKIQSSGSLAYEWFDILPNNINPRPFLIVYNNAVINITQYAINNVPYFGTDLHRILGKVVAKDGTQLLNSRAQYKTAMNCIERRYAAGVLSTQTIGCFATNIIMLVSLAVILAVIVIRFVMAIVFSWFMSSKLTKVVKTKDGLQVKGDPLYTIMLVTCYSEGEAGLRTTMDSLASTEYSDKHKLFCVIADGLIKGEGNKKTTPDICLDLIELPPDIPDPEPCSYIAIADGEKQFNMAKVYAGHYTKDNHRVPVILIVKVGSEKEQTTPKPGNRGKRDSQIILMSFFQHVYWNDRFTELDYELFWKIYYLMGVTADKFELILMVDADTEVAPTSLTYMVSAMKTDPKIMGLCGETRIANKTASWVSAIQVFEYFISHHLGKAFESVFGGVTCLPGCFCMYRLKAPKEDQWIPILSNPDVVSEYQQNIVTTLHSKNLLLLGEDRYLSTLMLRSFPKRKMMFVPEAMCHTVVPDEFSVLLSQRRRWINSTVHNLLELVLVSDLCGIACLSMQFMVMLELIGTVVLPAAICFTILLILMTILTKDAQVIPLLLLGAVLGLPGVLIVITTRKVVYVMWMIVYLLALPIWNFVLPVYAYWHFDDFSWGETRKVSGDDGGDDHGKKAGVFDTSMIVMKKWEDWERERRCMTLKKLPLRNSIKTGSSEASSRTAVDRNNQHQRQQGNRHLVSDPTLVPPKPLYANSGSNRSSHEHEYQQNPYPHQQPYPASQSQSSLLSHGGSGESLNSTPSSRGRVSPFATPMIEQNTNFFPPHNFTSGGPSSPPPQTSSSSRRNLLPFEARQSVPMQFPPPRHDSG
ncbi:12913_t:CDS:2, partial [Ambispora leptoticha]